MRRRGAAHFRGDGHEEMLGADVLVLEAVGLGLRLIGDELDARRKARLRPAVRLRNLLEQFAGVTTHRHRVDGHLAQQVGDDALALFDERDEQMLGLDLGVVHLLGQFDGRGHSLAAFFGVLVDVHDRDAVEIWRCRRPFSSFSSAS